MLFWPFIELRPAQFYLALLLAPDVSQTEEAEQEAADVLQIGRDLIPPADSGGRGGSGRGLIQVRIVRGVVVRVSLAQGLGQVRGARVRVLPMQYLPVGPLNIDGRVSIGLEAAAGYGPRIRRVVLNKITI